jgi:acyl CoA:acetate/3-ketoacid CoA transferase beta subunit
VIASVERIVPDSVIDTIADRVVVPAQRVIGLCEAPRGAHPQALRTGGVAKVPGYGDDYLFMADTARQCGEPLEAERWYSRWVDLPDGHAGYLRTLAERRPAELPRGTPPKALTAAERVVLLTARSLVSLVLGEGYDCFFAGVGLSHLAAWCAAEELTERGIAVRVCAETGLSGMRPADGDPFLFGHAHVERCEALSSVLEMLGILGSADRGRWLGVLSAAEVDSRGCLNTVRTPDGRWLTGSGGANDIGTSIDCVVAAVAAPHRYVPRVAHVTTPGHRVREVVSQFGRFRRTGPEASPFRLATWLPPNPQGTPGEAMAALTRWAWADEGDAPCPEHAFSDEEITRLRRFDPAGHFR